MSILIVNNTIFDPNLCVSIPALSGSSFRLIERIGSDQVEHHIRRDPIVQLNMRSAAGCYILVFFALRSYVKFAMIIINRFGVICAERRPSPRFTKANYEEKHTYCDNLYPVRHKYE